MNLLTCILYIAIPMYCVLICIDIIVKLDWIIEVKVYSKDICFRVKFIIYC